MIVRDDAFEEIMNIVFIEVFIFKLIKLKPQINLNRTKLNIIGYVWTSFVKIVWIKSNFNKY